MAENQPLREFLRTRRARLQPGDVGLVAGAGRRVPGLRREEVAMLAGVSVDYYLRLEQGRDLQPSDQVLDAIARGLRLNEVERVHLHRLVRSTRDGSGSGGLDPIEVDEGTRLLVESIAVPGLIIDALGEVHAMNAAARALLVGLEPRPSARSNHTRWLFLEPATRDLIVDWEVIAHASVSVLRETAGRHPDDPGLHSLVGELSVASPQFRTWWAEHEVDQRCRGPKRFRHPVVGDLVLHVEALQLHDGQRWLYTYAVEPGTPSADAMRLLGSWSASRSTAEGAADGAARSDAEVSPGT
jgi:transcriptional regulator with XRE-family HTH domain